MIRQHNYEVGPDLIARFAAEDRAQQPVSSPRRRATAMPCSISAAMSRARLRAPASAQIEDLGLCTYAEPGAFFSFRRTTHRGEADYGRHVNAIALLAE